MSDVTAKFQLDTTLDTEKSITELEDGDLIIEGYASTVGLDRAGDLILPGAFDEAVEKFMASNPILLYNHDLGKPLGQFLDLKATAKGLWAKARIDAPAAGSWAEDVVRKIKRGTIKAFSVRGKMWRPDGRIARASIDGGGKVNRVDLYEISATPLPVEPGSLFAVTSKAFDLPRVPAEEISEQEAELLDAYFAERIGRLEQAYAELTRGVDAITSAAAEREAIR